MTFWVKLSFLFVLKIMYWNTGKNTQFELWCRSEIKTVTFSWKKQGVKNNGIQKEFKSVVYLPVDNLVVGKTVPRLLRRKAFSRDSFAHSKCLTDGEEVKNSTYNSLYQNSDFANFPRITQQCWQHRGSNPIQLRARRQYTPLQWAILPFFFLYFYIKNVFSN